MKKMMAFIFITVLLITTYSAWTEGLPGNLPFSPQPTRRFDTTTTQYFDAPELSMKMLLIFHEKNKEVNHFCIVGYEWDDDKWGKGFRRAPVYWKEGGRIVWWNGHVISQDNPTYLNTMITDKSTQLDTETVPTEEDRISPHYEVRSEVDAVINDCEKHGKRYTIEPFTPPPACTDDCSDPDIDPLSLR